MGLTAFGREVVGEMNRLGILIDCSHASPSTCLEAMRLSTDPVIFSHSNPRALCDHQRNITDGLIKACADQGGVIGVNGIGLFLGGNDISPARIADHIDYLVNLAGVDHVGIGLDYASGGEGSLDALFASHPEYWPPEQYGQSGNRFASPAQLPLLARELLRRSYHQKDLEKILGGNFLRVARQVWK